MSCIHEMTEKEFAKFEAEICGIPRCSCEVHKRHGSCDHTIAEELRRTKSPDASAILAKFDTDFTAIFKVK